MPSCVFHCYGCPLATFACPIGVIANFSALHLIPALTIGLLVLVGGLVGSLVCGWACPFGFLQDLLAKIPTPKLRLPAWTSYTRYAVLLGLVILVPYFSLQGIDDPLAICRVCPAGALEGGVPRMAGQAMAGQTVVWMSLPLIVIAAVFVLASLFIYRPWCRVFCPLGAILGIFNRVSVFHLRFRRERCTSCNLCRSKCSYGVKVDERVNTSRCIRCMECTTCGAIAPAVGLPRQK
jgi:polyferredoxin